ncbi:histone deacetylase family protein, partial [Vibrio cholerae]
MIPLIYHPIYSQLDLPVGHRYPINKYRLLYEEIVRQREQSEAWQASFEFHTPIAAELSRITRLHDPDYVQALLEGTLSAAKMRRIGFPWSKPLIERTLYSVGGTCLTVEQALQSGVAIHLSGGYHHAHADFGSGFCLFNDLAIAAHFALSLPSVDKVLIIDSDVHHGDGTATLCAERDEIITLSFHCDKN